MSALDNAKETLDFWNREHVGIAGVVHALAALIAEHDRVLAERAAPPAYLALDLWQALALPVGEFYGYYERNGWADTWSNLLAAVRARSGRTVCPVRVDGEDCVLTDGHIGPHMGASDVGSWEPLPKDANQTEGENQ